MSSDQERDQIDYVEDTSQHEDETLFLPTPHSRPDDWTLYFSGILTALLGGALPTVAPWLAGVLIFAGYGMAAYSLKPKRRRFGRALRFGFVAAALFGLAMLASEAVVPLTAWKLIEAAGERHVMFASVVALPWALAAIKYVYMVIVQEKRSVQAKAA